MKNFKKFDLIESARDDIILSDESLTLLLGGEAWNCTGVYEKGSGSNGSDICAEYDDGMCGGYQNYCHIYRF